MTIDVSRTDLIKEIQALKEKSLIRDEVVAGLCKAIQESSIRKKELNAIMSGSKAVLGQKGFKESARAIFDYCRNLIGATSGYVALLNETGEEVEVLFPLIEAQMETGLERKEQNTAKGKRANITGG